MWWMLGALGADLPEPSDQTLVYYNARMALREGRALEATKLWLLRNALEEHTHRVSPHDEDFHSVTWAALGALGVCQDGFPTDEGGAGLWPVALHNHVVATRGSRPRKRPPPFDAFDIGRQQRVVSIGDVLSAEELRTVALYRGTCLRPRVLLLSTGALPNADLDDRRVAAPLLKLLLERSRETLVAERVRGTEAIEARLFDILLEQAESAARQARAEERERVLQARQQGIARESIEAIRTDEPVHAFPDGSEAAAILEASVSWDVDGWMALSPDRRLFLFDHATTHGGDPEAMDRIALGVLDRLIDDGDGTDATRWIPRVGDSASDRADVWTGERGRRLMALDRASGFGERGVIALHRGVALLEQGDLPGALRAFAYSLSVSPESRASEDVQSLSLRWLTYVASRFEVTDELLITVRELVPRREYAILLEDLMWAAAFRADGTSFERGIRNQGGRGALERRLALLEPLAHGDVDSFASGIGERMASSPSETTRFLRQLVERLELEDADVRASQLRTLARIREVLAPLAEVEGSAGRSATALLERTQAIVEGLGGLGPDASPEDRARALDPAGEVFAGSVRLAPSDPLPWPFRIAEVPAPSVFEPLVLTPVEWRDERGDWVFGWSIGG